jgi:hypothetical protein
MFYEFFLIVIGIYVGQEYDNVPSVSYVISNVLKYSRQSIQTENESEKKSQKSKNFFLDMIFNNFQ